MARLRERSSPAADALEFLILTAARSGEVRGMTAGEVDLDAAIWTVPGGRMKGGRPHRVPLNPRTVEILCERIGEGSPPDALVFPGPVSSKAMSDVAFTALLKRMGQGNVTAHGFRS